MILSSPKINSATEQTVKGDRLRSVIGSGRVHECAEITASCTTIIAGHQVGHTRTVKHKVVPDSAALSVVGDASVYNLPTQGVLNQTSSAARNSENMSQLKVEQRVEIERPVGGASARSICREGMLNRAVEFDIVERRWIEKPPVTVTDSVARDVVAAKQCDTSGNGIPVSIKACSCTAAESGSAGRHIDDNVDIVAKSRPIPVDDDVFPLLNDSIHNCSSSIGIHAKRVIEQVGVVARISTIRPCDRRQERPVFKGLQPILNGLARLRAGTSNPVIRFAEAGPNGTEPRGQKHVQALSQKIVGRLVLI